MNKQNSSGRHFMAIIFLVTVLPILIMGVIFFFQLSEYNMYEEAADKIKMEAEQFNIDSSDVSRFVQIPTGEVAVFTDTLDHGFQLREWLPETETIENSYSIDSDIFERLFFTYQPLGIVFATKGDDKLINLYTYQYGSKPTKIDYSPIFINTYLEQSTIVFNNQFFFIGTNEMDDFIALTTHNEQVETINFSQMTNIQNITDVEFYRFSFSDIAYPVVKITTYDRSEYYYDLYHSTNQTLQTFNDETRQEIESQLIAPYYATQTPLLNVEDAAISDELFYPEFFYLTQGLSLIVGATGVKETDPISGYLIDNNSKNVIKRFEHSDIWQGYRDSKFQPLFLEETNTLYISGSNHSGMIALDSEDSSLAGLNDYEVALADQQTAIMRESDRLLKEGQAFSFSKIISFIRNDTAGSVLLTNSIIFAAIPFLIFGWLYLRSRHARKQIETAYVNGGRKITGTITSVSQTGLYVNEQPQVKMGIRFQHKGSTRNNQLKMIADLIQPPRVGDRIDVIYDPIRNKLFLDS